MFNYKDFSFPKIFIIFYHILQTKLSQLVQIPDIVNASIIFPISCQPCIPEHKNCKTILSYTREISGLQLRYLRSRQDNSGPWK